MSHVKLKIKDYVILNHTPGKVRMNMYTHLSERIYLKPPNKNFNIDLKQFIPCRSLFLMTKITLSLIRYI